MKKTTALLLCLSMLLCLLAGCAAETPTPTESTPEPVVLTDPVPTAPEKIELVVFAAASMTETLTELGDRYMATHENVTIVFNFDSSGTLKTQIEEGAVCDVFISAGQ